jgi:lipopolysaccharide/colanic/teichoic acid biosynthesis glycosyltransferase
VGAPIRHDYSAYTTLTKHATADVTQPAKDGRNDAALLGGGNPAEFDTSPTLFPASPESVLADESTVPSRAHDVLVRTVNVFLSAGALLVLSPLFSGISLAVRLDSRGPIFYRQVRVGLDRRSMGHSGKGRRAQDSGERAGGARFVGPERRKSRRDRRTENAGGMPFLILKFRTMHVGAEKKTGPIWASENDSRVTRVGQWLRRYRLDEVPQFWNVLKGDMAVVGPRPERPRFVRLLRDEVSTYVLRQRVRPGITGLAQVNRPPDRSVDDVRVKLDYDLEYLARRTPWLDLQVMLKTVPVVLRRR